MKKGKISDTILGRSVFKLLGKRGNTVKPAYGQDAAHINNQEKPVLASVATGDWAVYRAVNNISAVGGVADCIMDTVMIDEKSREIRLKEIIKELDRQCCVAGVGIAGGHTTVTDKVNSPVVSVTAIGHQERMQHKAEAGQDIVVTKHIGMSGIRTLTDCKRDEILKVYPEDIFDKALDDESQLLVAKEAELFMKESKVGAMHDVSEGGIFGALWDMAEYSGVGLEVDLRQIPVKQEIIEICELFNINPYILDSMGCLLMTCENGCDIINMLHQNGIEAAVIGKVTSGNDRIIHNSEEDRFLGLPEQDEIYKFI